MTQEKIIALFNDCIQEKNIHLQLDVSKSVVSHWRRDRQPTFGTMLDVLYKLKKVTVMPNDI